MFTTDGFRFVALALMGLSAVTCGTLLLGGWRQCHRQPAGPAGAESTAAAPLPFALARSPFAGSELDVAAELRHVLDHMAAEAAHHLVQLEFAAQPDLTVHADRQALGAVLSELVGRAMQHAPCGRVLLSAVRLGGRVQIAVIDDGEGPAAALQEAAFRDMAQLVALQGGTVDVEIRPGEGTTVFVRLPEPMPAAKTPETRKPLPAERFAVPAYDAREAVVEHSWDI